MELITFPLTKTRLTQMLSDSQDARVLCFRRENGFQITEDREFSLGI